MRFDGITAAIILCFIVIAVAIVLLFYAGEDCKQQGGEVRFTHYLYIWSGKSMIMTPQYECNIPKK